MVINNVYTDGSCLGNPGKGGWAVYFEELDVKLSGNSIYTTNNRMELEAIAKALSYVKDNCLEGKVIIHSDSAYAINALTSGNVRRWSKKCWKLANGKQAKNVDIWDRILYLIDKVESLYCTIEFMKVKGHSGEEFNELVDEMARKEAQDA